MEIKYYYYYILTFAIRNVLALMFSNTHAIQSDNGNEVLNNQNLDETFSFVTSSNDVHRTENPESAQQVGHLRETFLQAKDKLNSIQQKGDAIAESVLQDEGKDKANGNRQKRSMQNDISSDVTEEDKINECILLASKRSREKFNSRVLHYEADMIMLNLNFSQNIIVDGRPGVILPLKWRWVYTETTSYLRMPYSASLWSLGLLSLHNGEC